MSDTIKVRDKITGEVITLQMKGTSPTKGASAPVSRKESLSAGVASRTSTAKEEISKRGNILGNVVSNLASPNPVRKGMGVLGVAAAPLSMLESGIANPALKMQEGNFNPIDLAKESFLGFTGQKQGQYGDVARIAGYPKPIAATIGLVASMSPLKAGQAINKTFGSIKRLSDKGIIKAGESLINATREATQATGIKVGEAFKAVENIKVDPNRFIDSVSKLPKALISELEDRFGSLSDMSELNIGQLRAIKQVIGKFRPGVFGKEARGVAENIEAEKINQVYGAIKKMLSNSVEIATNKKTASALMELEDAYSKVSKSSDYIQKTIVESTLGQATKGGAMAKKLALEGDVSGRTAMNILKQSGARKSINDAVRSLEAFNKWQAIGKFGKHAMDAAMFGGAVGSLGGLVANKVYNKDTD
jgi:hypothetical protein